MITNFLLVIPLIGVFFLSMKTCHSKDIAITDVHAVSDWSSKQFKSISLQISICTLLLSLVMFALFDFSKNQFQFVLEYHEINSFNFYLGVDGLSIYFVILTTIIMPVSLLSNWTSISSNVKIYVITILLLETLLLSVFLVLDILSYYIFFESILPPLFILIGSFGSSNRVRASLYLFIYTLLGSLFLLLSIVTMSSITGTTDFDALFKPNFNYYFQFFLFCGIFIAFAVKTPIIFLNSWLLKAHVESPLSGSIILAGIVLKLSLYGIFRLILPLLPKAYINCTFFIYLIGVITIIYASMSTLRTIDMKELIAYSSVSHAAVYLMGVFSNTIQGIEGGIALGLAHGFVSSGLFICAGGVLYDRSSIRLITYYRGIAQMMPIFSVILFVLCLGNCGVPLTLNFVGEFLSLYGTFERSPILGVLASSSIIFSAAYTIYMFNRIAFSGSFSKFFIVNISDLNKREFYVLLNLLLFTVTLGIYPAPVLDGLHYSVATLIYSVPNLYIITNFFKGKRLLDWELSSPPKPTAFAPLQVQSGFFSSTFNIKSILSKCRSNFYVFLLTFIIALGYKLPVKFMLAELDLLLYYPIFNFIFALISVVAIANLKSSKITKFTILIAGVLGLSVPYLLPYVYDYSAFWIGYLFEGFASIVVLIKILLDLSPDKQYIGGNSDTFVSKLKDCLSSPNRNYSKNIGDSGSTMSGLTESGNTGSGISASASGSGAHGRGSSATGGSISSSSAAGAESSSSKSVSKKESKSDAEIVAEMKADMLAHAIETIPPHLAEVRHLEKMLKYSKPYNLTEPEKPISNALKSEILRVSQTRWREVKQTPPFVNARALDYWAYMRIYNRTLNDLNTIKLMKSMKSRFELSSVEDIIFNARVTELKNSLKGARNVSFNKLQDIYKDDLKHQDKKILKKHYEGHVTPKTSIKSDSESGGE